MNQKISEQAIAKREEATERALQPIEPLPPAPAPPPPARRERVGSVKQIATAIAAVTGEIGVVPKLGTNAFHHYKYAAMSDIVVRLNKLMANHGLVIVQSETSRQWVDQGAAISITYEFTIAHSSGEVWPDRPQSTGLSRCRDSKGGFDDKSINKCHTAARKYFLISLFQIATGDESDADAGENEKARKVVTSSKQPYPSPQEQKLKEITPEAIECAKRAADEAGIVTLEDKARELADKGTDAYNRWQLTLDNYQRRRLTSISPELLDRQHEADEAIRREMEDFK